MPGVHFTSVNYANDPPRSSSSQGRMHVGYSPVHYLGFRVRLRYMPRPFCIHDFSECIMHDFSECIMHMHKNAPEPSYSDAGLSSSTAVDNSASLERIHGSIVGRLLVLCASDPDVQSLDLARSRSVPCSAKKTACDCSSRILFTRPEGQGPLRQRCGKCR